MDTPISRISYQIEYLPHTTSLNFVSMDMKFDELKALKKRDISFKIHEDIQGGFQNFVILVWIVIDNGA